MRSPQTPDPYRRWPLALLLLGALLLGTGAPAAADDEKKPAGDEKPTVEQVLARYIEAAGGEAAHRKIRNRVTESTLDIVQAGITGKITISHARPAKVHTFAEIEGLGTVEKGTDGEVAWEISTMGGPSIKEGLERAQILRDAHFDKMIDWKLLYPTSKIDGVAEVDERPCHKVLLTPEEGAPVTWYFDDESHLLVRADLAIETEMGTIPVQMFVGDYREVDGVRIPFLAKVLVMGQERRMVTTGVKHDVELPEGRFDLPEPIVALLQKKKEKEAEDAAGEKPGGESDDSTEKKEGEAF